MRRQHHRHPRPGEPADDIEHLTDQLRVQGGGHLVEQQQLGLHRQRANDRHALLLTAGESVGKVRSLVRQAESGQQLLRIGLHLARRATRNLARAERDVVEHGQVREQVVRLKDDADPPAHRIQVDVVRRHVDVADMDRSGVDGLEPVDAPQQRGLARPRRTDEAHDLAGADVERDAAQHRDVPEALVHAIDAQQRSLTGCPPSAGPRSRASMWSVIRASGIVSAMNSSAAATVRWS